MSIIPGRRYYDDSPGKFAYNPEFTSYDADAWNCPFHNAHTGAPLTVPHNAFSRSVVHGSTTTEWNETANAYIFKIRLQGLAKNDVKLEIEDGRILCITGEKVEKQEGYKRWNYVENMKFVTRVELPHGAKLDKNKITAYMENEELTITIPKKEVKKQHYSIPIPITGPQGAKRF